ncbi:HNH endonuclease [Paenibacillus sp. NEAU-GSW1]|uniref:HNH endonuclease n=1 Tax=Paenibacillus sp. NEAU-GSW1 TaxID=2682486 RepID=UPI0012E32214|nr:HNH endonuclease [Paenibacillus sp. NEAU-GSW1]MUT64394.1 HNH endonuclease [Paenibacillus sp. NEAU-GSW1]
MTEQSTMKTCVHCHESKPLGEFLRRTGRRSGQQSRRGACRNCRKLRQVSPVAASEAPIAAPVAATAGGGAQSAGAVTCAKPARSRQPLRPQIRQQRQPKPANHSPTDPSCLRPTRQGKIWMRGKTDKGRRWYQEIDLELAVILVKERAAVVVNRHTIRRLFSNKDFRKYILTRDQYTCYFCGEYGDTIDHMLPRAKGGHTTPDNCVCACNACNQSKADKDLEQFMRET